LINEEAKKYDKGIADENFPNLLSIGGENNIMSIQFIDMIPGDRFRIEFAAGGQEPLEI
jgi:hypothetical protein